MPSARLMLVGCVLLLACAHAAPVEPPAGPPRVESPFVPPDDAITLKASETWESEDGSLLIEVVNVIDYSSPCPPGSQCVWSGIVRQVILNVTLDEETSAWRLNEQATRRLGPWRIEVLNVTGPDASLRLILDPQRPAGSGCASPTPTQ